MTLELGHIIDLLGIVGVPFCIYLLRAIRNLEMTHKEIQGDHKVLDEKVHHIEGNYKQGIEFVKESMKDLKGDISELKTVIMEIVKK